MKTRWPDQSARLRRWAVRRMPTVWPGSRLMPWIAGSLVFLAALWLGAELYKTERSQLERHIELGAGRISSDVSSALDDRLRALDRLARLGHARGGWTAREWEAEAAFSLGDLTGLVALAWLGVDQRPIRWAPATGNPLGEFPAQLQEPLGAVLTAATHAGRPTLGKVTILPDGSHAILGAAAMGYGESKGWIVGVFDPGLLLGSVLARSVAAGFVIEITEGDRLVYRSSGDAMDSERAWAREALLPVGGRLWLIRVWPRPNWVTRRWLVLPYIVAGLGLAVGALLSLSIHWAYTARRRASEAETINRELEREVRERKQAQEELARAHEMLEERVRERTAELARVNEALRAEILERQRTEETLRASEERYRNLFDSATDIVYTHDLQGRFTSINRAAERITGYTREEALRLTIADVVAPEHLELARQMIVRKLGGEVSTVYELTVLTKEGHRLLVEVSSHLMFEDGKPVGVLGIAREITERKRLEEQLRQSQKIEAIGRLAGGIAHDFNNLLTIIGAYSHMLLMDLPSDHPVRSYAQEILAAAERASALTDRLLAFSRRQVVQPVLVDLNEVIRNLAGLLRRMVGEDIELVTNLAPDLGKVRADPTQLEQVIMNLVINSRDAMPGGGQVMLETANLLVERAEPGGIGPGSWTVLRVRDTGHGMDAETQSHLFEPFFTTKAPGKGTGLGLSIVYGIVKQSGGEIAVQSEVGKGTVFTIYLPHAGAAPAAEAPVQQAAPEPVPGAGETILLVEDEPGVRKLVRQMLVQQGYHVLEAASGPEALALAERHPGRIDLLLTDVVMPQINGRELAVQLQAMRPGIKLIYMTGYTEDAVVRHGVSTAGVVCLQKPFLPDTLARKVREVLDRAEQGGY